MYAPPPPGEPHGAEPRRVALIDFSWSDLDVVPDLLHTPGVSVSLVAGVSEHDAGVRFARMCGLRPSTDLEDLAREIVDVALIGDASPRRDALARLLQALGTRIESPAAFAARATGRVDPAGGSDPESLAASGGVAEAPGEWEALFDGIDVSTPSASTPDPGSPPLAGAMPVPVPDPAAAATRQAPPQWPGPDDVFELERALDGWVAGSDAASAALHRVLGGRCERLARIGPEDPLLDLLVERVRATAAPQLVVSGAGDASGRAWGAWPVHGGATRGVLAAGRFVPRTGSEWETVARDLARAWRDDPAVPALLAPARFQRRLDAALERERVDGFRFSLYRIVFEDGADGAVETTLETLAARLRAADAVCRTAAGEALLLCGGAANAFERVHERLRALWSGGWHAEHATPGAPRVEAVSADDAIARLAAAAAVGS